MQSSLLVSCCGPCPPSQAGNSKRAVDCCVLLHQWDQAMTLAQSHNYPQAEQLLLKYAAHLLEKKKYMDAVELYRKVSSWVLKLDYRVSMWYGQPGVLCGE